MKTILIIILTISLTFAQKPKSEILLKRGRKMVVFGILLSCAYGAGIPLIIGGIAVKYHSKKLKEKELCSE